MKPQLKNNIVDITIALIAFFLIGGFFILVHKAVSGDFQETRDCKIIVIPTNIDEFSFVCERKPRHL